MNGRVALAWGLVLLAACNGGDAVTDDTPTDGDTGPTTPTDFEGFVPYAFGVDYATFAVDGSGQAVPYTTAAGVVPVTVRIVLVDETVDTVGVTADNSCSVTWRTETPVAPAAWTGGVAAFAGWTLPADATVEDDCGALEFPPPWEGGPQAALASWEFGVGLGALDPAVEDLLPEWFGADWETLAPFVAGAGYYWDGLTTIEDLPVDDWEDGWVDTSVAYAYELEEDFSVRMVGGKPVAIEAADLYPGNTPIVARYDLQATTLLTPGKLLVTE